MIRSEYYYFYGYLNAQNLKNVFTTCVYQKDDDFYLAQVENYEIIKFFLLPQIYRTDLNPVINNCLPVYVDSSPCYCYVDNNGNIVAGKYSDIIAELDTLLNDNATPDVGKLKISAFLLKHEQTTELVEKINEKLNINFLVENYNVPTVSTLSENTESIFNQFVEHIQFLNKHNVSITNSFILNDDKIVFQSVVLNNPVNKLYEIIDNELRKKVEDIINETAIGKSKNYDKRINKDDNLFLRAVRKSEGNQSFDIDKRLSPCLREFDISENESIWNNLNESEDFLREFDINEEELNLWSNINKSEDFLRESLNENTVFNDNSWNEKNIMEKSYQYANEIFEFLK